MLCRCAPAAALHAGYTPRPSRALTACPRLHRSLFSADQNKDIIEGVQHLETRPPRARWSCAGWKSGPSASSRVGWEPIPRLRPAARRMPERWPRSEPPPTRPPESAEKGPARHGRVRAWGGLLNPELRASGPLTLTGERAYFGAVLLNRSTISARSTRRRLVFSRS